MAELEQRAAARDKFTTPLHELDMLLTQWAASVNVSVMSWLRSVFFGLTSVAIAKNDKALCLKKDRAVFSAEQTLRCFLSLDAEGARLYG